MSNITSISTKVDFLLSKAKSKKYSDEELQKIVSYASEHSDSLILGRVFGYSVSDYALATLKWINDSRTREIFDELFNTLSFERRQEIERLISRNLYAQY